jgi:hypothetical protein
MCDDILDNGHTFPAGQVFALRSLAVYTPDSWQSFVYKQLAAELGSEFYATPQEILCSCDFEIIIIFQY